MLDEVLRFRERFLEAPAVLVHGDPWHTNLFAHEDGRLRALIDFDAARLAPPAADLRYALSLGPRFAENVFAAYAADGGDVNRAEIGRAQLLHAFEHIATVDPTTERHPRMIEWARTAAPLSRG